MMFEKYDAYKDSGIGLIGNIPENWFVKKLKFITQINSSSLPENHPKNDIISYVDIGNVSYEKGIGDVQQFKFSESPSRARRIANCGDTVVSTVRTYLKAIAYVNEKESEYIYSTGFAVLSPNEELNSKFLLNFVRSNSFTHQVDIVAKGMSYPAINSTELANLWVAFPDKPAQEKIVDFLDQKTSEIDQAIAIKEKQIALLNERKQIVIQKAVTQGLDPNVPMKDSGVEWIGEIPEHWEIKKLKYVLEERSERSRDGLEPLLMMSQIHGLVVRSEYSDKAEVAATTVGNKLVYHNDLVFNKLKAHLGVFFGSVHEFVGSASPDYAVYKPIKYIENSKFLELLFRNPLYIKQFILRSSGIVEGLIRLYTTELFDLKIAIPPNQEQKDILNFVEQQSVKFDEVIENYIQQIEKLKEYKTTLINDVVTGKIKVA